MEKSIFATLCCGRLVPNYINYKKLIQPENNNVLDEVIAFSWDCIVNQFKPGEPELRLYLENFMLENVDSAESIGANWAQDALIAGYDLIRFYLEERDIYVRDIAWTCIETIQKFILSSTDILIQMIQILIQS